jgi:hypothetical protein
MKDNSPVRMVATDQAAFHLPGQPSDDDLPRMVPTCLDDYACQLIQLMEKVQLTKTSCSCRSCGPPQIAHSV